MRERTQPITEPPNPYGPIKQPTQRYVLFTTPKMVYGLEVDVTYHPITGGVVVDRRIVTLELSK